MRAGHYAVVEGRTYRAVPSGDYVRLLVSGSEPQPPGFRRDNRGRWKRVVRADEVSRLFHVRTTARWNGTPVEVTSVLGESAEIKTFDPALDPDGRPEISRDRTGEWVGGVPITELTGVVEDVIEGN